MEMNAGERLRSHIDQAKEKIGTHGAWDMLHLRHTAENNYAANLYLTALHYIARLETEIKALEEKQ